MKFFSLSFLLIVMLVAPVLVSAEIIPCTNDCDFADIFKLINNIIDWIIMISIPISAGVFAWAGFIFMTTGIADQKNDARNMIKKVFLGLIFILAAWLIVNTITNTLLNDEFKEAVPVEGTK